MRRRWLYILILGFTLTLLVSMAVSLSAQRPAVGFYDTVTGMELVPTLGPDNVYELILPAHTSRNTVRVQAAGQVMLNGANFSGESLMNVPLDIPVEIIGERHGKRNGYMLRVRQAAGIGTLSIQGNEDLLTYLHEDRERRTGVSVSIVDVNGAQLLRENASMSGRGNGTWDRPKRPYNLDFARTVSLGDFREVKQLCLLAEYTDESKLRNLLAFYTGKKMGIDYSSEYLPVNVYVNGEYQGLYGIASKEAYLPATQSGGIRAVFEQTSESEKADFSSGFLGLNLRVLYGDVETVEEAVNTFEFCLWSEDWKACAEKCDIASFARKYAMEELLGNHDMTYGSQYFYLDAKGILRCMLPWDYEWCLRDEVTHHASGAGDLKVMHRDSWYGQLLRFAPYRREVIRSLEEYDEAVFRVLGQELNRAVEQTQQSAALDALHWKGYEEDAMAEYAAGFLDYFPRRKAFLVDYFEKPMDYCHVEFRISHSVVQSCLCVPTGAQLQAYLGDFSFLKTNTWISSQGLRPQEVETVSDDITFLLVNDESYGHLP